MNAGCCDRDSKFTPAFDEVFAGNCSQIIKTPVQAPGRTPPRSGMWARYAASAPGHLLVYGERHLRQILAEYAQHYNHHQPHQSREHRPRLHEPSQAIDMTARIKRR